MAEGKHVLNRRVKLRGTDSDAPTIGEGGGGGGGTYLELSLSDFEDIGSKRYIYRLPKINNRLVRVSLEYETIATGGVGYIYFKDSIDKTMFYVQANIASIGYIQHFYAEFEEFGGGAVTRSAVGSVAIPTDAYTTNDISLTYDKMQKILYPTGVDTVTEPIIQITIDKTKITNDKIFIEIT